MRREVLLDGYLGPPLWAWFRSRVPCHFFMFVLLSTIYKVDFKLIWYIILDVYRTSFSETDDWYIVLYYIVLCWMGKVLQQMQPFQFFHFIDTITIFYPVILWGVNRAAFITSVKSCAYFLCLTGRFNCPHVPGDLGMEFPTDPNHSARYKSVLNWVPPGSLHITSHSPHRCNMTLRQAVIFDVQVSK